MTNDQEQLAASYHDNCWTKDLKKLIGSAEELKRINDYSKTDWSQDQLDEVIKLAIKWREEGF